jgi:predicted permease
MSKQARASMVNDIDDNNHDFIDDIVIDIRYALSRFITQPVTTAIIVLTLALSIGATAAIFSVVNGLLFQATPFKESEKLVVLQQEDLAKQQTYGFSAKEMIDYQAQSKTFEEMSEYHNMTFTMYGNGEPIRVRTGVVSSNFFNMLNITPLHGRVFTEEEDDIGAEPLVLLTYEFWQREFNGQSDVIDQNVEFNNRSHKIIGILPHFPQFPDINDVYMAIPSCPWRSGENALSNRSARMMSGFAKIKENYNLDDVNIEMKNIAEALGNTYPEAYSESAAISGSALSLHDELVKSSRPYLYTLLATTILLFLIASANVTNLTLSQHSKRRREFAVRASLGASKARLAQLLLTESLILSLFGGALGLLFAYLGLDFLKSFASNFSSLSDEISIDGTVMTFVLVISITSGVITGIVPSFSKINLVSSLKEGGKSSYSIEHGFLRNSLLVGQFALSLTLLIAAGLTIKSLSNLQNIDVGFNAKGIGIAQIDLNWTTYNNDQQRWQVSQQILQEVRKLPYVSSSALSMTYPNDIVGSNFNRIRQAVQLDDRDFNPEDALPSTFLRPITDGYFDLLESKIIMGRDISSDDDMNGAPVGIINKKLAEKWWPNESALNHNISLDQGRTWITIIGVVENIHEGGAAIEPSYQVYLPMAQASPPHIAILVKHEAEQDTLLTGSFTHDIKSIVKQLDSRQPLSKLETLQQAADNSIALQRFLAQLLTMFSIIALVITISGISGVMGYMVNLRTREIGIRMAVGADKVRVLILMLSYGIKLTLIGLVIGVVAAYNSGSWLASQLFGINGVDVVIYSNALLILLFISVVACFIPAWKASSIPPMKALKQ